MMYATCDFSARRVYSVGSHAADAAAAHSAAPIPTSPRHVADLAPATWTRPAPAPAAAPTTSYRIPADLSAPAAPAADDYAPATYIPATYNIPATDAIDGICDLAGAYLRAADRYAARGDLAAAAACYFAHDDYAAARAAARAADRAGMPAPDLAGVYPACGYASDHAHDYDDADLIVLI